jgi:AraC-like DNA-binding protein
MNEIRFNIFAIFLIFAFLQGLIYSTLLLLRARREGRKSDNWLALLILTVCVYNMPYMLGFMGIHILYQGLYFFPYRIELLIGPVILYFIKHQTNQQFQMKRADYYHFIPYFVYFGYHLAICLCGDTYRDWWHEHIHQRFYIDKIELLASNLLPCIYLYWSWKWYQNYLKWLPNERSDTEQSSFIWYRYFMLAIVIAIISALIFGLAGQVWELSFFQVWVQRAFNGVIIYYLSIQGYHQYQPKNLNFKREQYLQLPESTPTADIQAAEGKREKLSSDELIYWKEQITQVLQKEQLFLQPDITLSALARRLDTNTSLVSYVINTGFEKNFNDFINEFRVQIFLQRVKEAAFSHYSLLSLAYDCGFNSKSTFNRAVKKITGQQPSDFLTTS